MTAVLIKLLAFVLCEPVRSWGFSPNPHSVGAPSPPWATGESEGSFVLGAL